MSRKRKKRYRKSVSPVAVPDFTPSDPQNIDVQSSANAMGEMSTAGQSISALSHIDTQINNASVGVLDNKINSKAILDRHAINLSITVLLLLIGVTYLVYWAYQPSTVKLSTALTSIEKISVTLPSPGENYINPASGSYSYTGSAIDPSSYRGIGFLAQRVEIGTGSHNEKYKIISPPTNDNRYKVGFSFSVSLIQ